MNWLVSYYIRTLKTITVSPSTGKLYKRPRRIREYLDIAEWVKADNTEQALEIARFRAKQLNARIADIKPEPRIIIGFQLPENVKTSLTLKRKPK